MRPESEIRTIEVEGLEVRAGDDDTPTKVVGVVAPFNKLSGDLGGFREKIEPGAFAKTIKNDDIRSSFNHDLNFVLGRTTAGTLQLEETTKGLRMEAEVPDTQWAKDLMVSIERGDINQGSFRFASLKDEWDETDKDNIVRTLKEVRLFEVGPVTFPAYPQSKLQARNLERVVETAGVDVNAINRVLIRAEHNLDLTDDDRQAVDLVITRLRELVPEAEDPSGDLNPPDGDHDGSADQVGIMRQRLELDVAESNIQEVQNE